jgi:hypothetical protein
MSVALSAGAEGEGSSTKANEAAVIKLLAEALELLDVTNAPPELAARVQETLDAVVASGSWTSD